MNHLLRERAPMTDAAWQELDREAREHLLPALAARRLVDLAGPHGWAHSAVNIGRSTDIDEPLEGLRARQRRVMPLAELRAFFALSRTELDDFERGATDIDLLPLDQAAARMARAENIAVFHGWPTAVIEGIAAGTFPPVALPGDYRSYPAAVAKAVKQLRTAGIAGPYGLALGPDAYTGVVGSAEHGGLSVFEHLRRILDGPVVWAPGMSGGVVVSLRSGDSTLHIGEDLSIGYLHHDADTVHLYLEESFTLVVTTAEAAAALAAEEAPAGGAFAPSASCGGRATAPCSPLLYEFRTQPVAPGRRVTRRLRALSVVAPRIDERGGEVGSQPPDRRRLCVLRGRLGASGGLGVDGDRAGLGGAPR